MPAISSSIAVTLLNLFLTSGTWTDGGEVWPASGRIDRGAGEGRAGLNGGAGYPRSWHSATHDSRQRQRLRSSPRSLSGRCM